MLRRPEAIMLTRLANVIYWFCSAVAILCALGILIALPTGGRTDYTGSIALCVLALASYGLGRAVRYVLSGK